MYRCSCRPAQAWLGPRAGLPPILRTQSLRIEPAVLTAYTYSLLLLQDLFDFVEGILRRTLRRNHKRVRRLSFFAKKPRARTPPFTHVAALPTLCCAKRHLSNCELCFEAVSRQNREPKYEVVPPGLAWRWKALVNTLATGLQWRPLHGLLPCLHAIFGLHAWIATTCAAL